MIIDYHVRKVCDAPDPFEYFRTVQTDVIDSTIECPAHPGGATRDFVVVHEYINIPTCVGNSPSDLKIRTNVGSAIVDDDHTVVADPTLKTWIKIGIFRKDSDASLEIYAFERTGGAAYGDEPSGYTLESYLKEFSVVATGTVLVEEEDWI